MNDFRQDPEGQASHAEEKVSSRYICTANHGFASYAQEELRRLFGAVKSMLLLPGEIFIATLQAEPEEVSRILLANLPIFLRHIQPVQFQDEAGLPALGRLAVYLSRQSQLEGQTISLQVRKSKDSFWQESPGELREWLQEELKSLDAEFSVQEPAWVISVYADSDALYAGVSRPEENLSDWSGGAVRFRKEEGQISRAKFKLIEAETAEMGLDLADAVRPDLILMDINLPGMDGYQALEKIKHNPRLRDIPVVAVTANAMRGDEERGLTAGFRAYLSKPFGVDAVYRLLDELSSDGAT